MATAPATHADDALLESILSLLTAYLHSGVTLPEECHRTLFAVTVHPLSTLLNRAPDLEGKAPVFDISSSVLYVRAELRSGVSGGFPVTHASVMLPLSQTTTVVALRDPGLRDCLHEAR